MSIESLKSRMRDLRGIDRLTMRPIVGRNVYQLNGILIGVDPGATEQQIETDIRHAMSPGMVYAAPIEGNALLMSADETPPIAPAEMPTPLPAVNLSEAKPMTAAPSGSFAASLRAMMDEARAGVAQARTDGLARVGEAIGKLNDAKTATAHVAGKMAATIEDEAASVLSELGQISNSLGLD